MRPLVIVAEMVSRVVMADPVHLDGLLMAAVAKRDNLPPLTTQAEALAAPRPKIPLALSSCGRYFLASAAQGETAARELRYVQRRFPLSEAISMGGASLKRVATNAGPCKAFRIPVETQHIPTLTWYAMGEPEEVRELLEFVTRVGKRRAVGEGLVASWHVMDGVETWPGFPVMKDGRPLRHLPLDTDGLVEFSMRIGRYAPPYWCRPGEEEIACTA